MNPDRDSGARDRLLFFLKTRGPQTTAELARRLDMTTMGVRGHLAKLEAKELVDHENEPRSVGRPAQVWRLTEAAASRFPEGYGDLAVDLLRQIRETFGAKGVDRLVRQRTRDQIVVYRERVPAKASLGKRVAALVRLRTAEGYMAESRKRRDGTYVLVENHCPICAAAEVCQGLCAGELELFRAALGIDVTVERAEHLLDGARRCVYEITPKG